MSARKRTGDQRLAETLRTAQSDAAGQAGAGVLDRRRQQHDHTGCRIQRAQQRQVASEVLWTAQTSSATDAG